MCARAKTIARIHLFCRGWDPDAQSHDMHIVGEGVYGKQSVTDNTMYRGIKHHLCDAPPMCVTIAAAKRVSELNLADFKDWVVMSKNESDLMEMLRVQLSLSDGVAVLFVPSTTDAGCDCAHIQPHIYLALAAAAYVCRALGYLLPQTPQDLIALLLGEAAVTPALVYVHHMRPVDSLVSMHIVVDHAIGGGMVVYQNHPDETTTCTLAEMMADATLKTINGAQGHHKMVHLPALEHTPASARSAIQMKLMDSAILANA